MLCHVCGSLWYGVGCPEELVSDTTGLPQSTEEGSVDCGWVLAYCVLPSKEQPRHVAWLRRCAWGCWVGCHRCSTDVIVVT